MAWSPYGIPADITCVFLLFYREGARVVLLSREMKEEKCALVSFVSSFSKKI